MVVAVATNIANRIQSQIVFIFLPDKNHTLFTKQNKYDLWLMTNMLLTLRRNSNNFPTRLQLTKI